MPTVGATLAVARNTIQVTPGDRKGRPYAPAVDRIFVGGDAHIAPPYSVLSLIRNESFMKTVTIYTDGKAAQPL